MDDLEGQNQPKDPDRSIVVGGARQESGASTLLTSPSTDVPDELRSTSEHALADFTLDPRSLGVAALAVVVGVVSAMVAWGLLDLIGLLTHLLYFGQVGARLIQPDHSRLGALAVLVPVGGGLVIGAMAYWGSERIRGHGIPEAMETILVGGSRVEPRLAVLKPISSAVSIGSGGPFGAEGPIILTGGAFGSVIAQFFRLSASERRTLLVAGACGGMAAVFGTPVAATMFGVELLVFEWRPRSMVPIALAAGVADVIRNVLSAHGFVSAAPLFPVAPHGQFSTLSVAAAAAIGVGGGALAWILTAAVYGAEDAFKRLPIHWAWWPAIGGLVIGLGGLIEPRALGVGYTSINAELDGRLTLGALAVLLIVKLVIWSIGLGSGTSGGILAPLMIMGAAMGGLMAPVLPGGSPASWALLGMAATLAGVTRSPFTSVVFAFELTHDTGSLLPLLVACAIAHFMSAMVLKRSILTEKVARRGFHVVREYQVEALEALFVREAMTAEPLTFLPEAPVAQLREHIVATPAARRQRLFPIVDGAGILKGVLVPSDLIAAEDAGGTSAAELARADVLVAYPDETLRSAADRMAANWVGALPVVARQDGRVVGVLTEFDLLKARQRQLVEERRRQRTLHLRPVSSPPALPSPREEPPEEGGDPACWAGLLCPVCGGVAGDGTGHREGCTASSQGGSDLTV